MEHLTSEGIRTEYIKLCGANMSALTGTESWRLLDGSLASGAWSTLLPALAESPMDDTLRTASPTVPSPGKERRKARVAGFGLWSGLAGLGWLHHVCERHGFLAESLTHTFANKIVHGFASYQTSPREEVDCVDRIDYISGTAGILWYAGSHVTPSTELLRLKTLEAAQSHWRDYTTKALSTPRFENGTQTVTKGCNLGLSHGLLGCIFSLIQDREPAADFQKGFVESACDFMFRHGCEEFFPPMLKVDDVGGWKPGVSAEQDSWCYGSFGLLLVLALAERTHPEWSPVSRPRIQRMLDLRRERIANNIPQDLGLCHGIAGQLAISTELKSLGYEGLDDIIMSRRDALHKSMAELYASSFSEGTASNRVDFSYLEGVSGALLALQYSEGNDIARSFLEPMLGRQLN